MRIRIVKSNPEGINQYSGGGGKPEPLAHVSYQAEIVGSYSDHMKQTAIREWNSHQMGVLTKVPGAEKDFLGMAKHFSDCADKVGHLPALHEFLQHISMAKSLDLGSLHDAISKLSASDKIRFANVMHGYLSGTLPTKD